VNPNPPSCPPLANEIYLREYEQDGAIPFDAIGGAPELRRNWFRDNRNEIQTISRDGDVFVGTTHFVGIIPFKCRNDPQCPGHLLVSLPKGAPRDSTDERAVNDSLLRFLELLALSSELVPRPLPPDIGGFEGIRGTGEKFLLLLAVHYAALIEDLCVRDFRRHYRHEEAPVQGRVRGRVHLAGHLRSIARGQAHVIPCRWDEFTPDNWDNRILDSAARALTVNAGRLDPAGGNTVRRLFHAADPYFALVNRDVPVFPWDLGRARLGRVSTRYKRTLSWASLIIRGLSSVAAGGTALKVAVDANDVFEKFARVIVSKAVAEVQSGWMVREKRAIPGLLENGPMVKPDILINDGEDQMIAVGDAKYKEVLELLDQQEGATDFVRIARQCVEASDLYQLYCYMRLTQTTNGFFVVPYWDAAADEPAARLLKDQRFRLSPKDGVGAGSGRPLAVLGLNMMKSPVAAAKEGQRELAGWLRGCVST